MSQIEEKITPRTKAIMVVHIYGLPVDMTPVVALTEKYNIKLIEDAAEAIGQTYCGSPCGSFGDISIFSFYPNKHITTGEGGMLMTDNAELAERCKALRNLCFQPNKRFVHKEIGWNYRMSNLQAAVGLAQLERIDFHVKRKRQIGSLYNGLLADLGAVNLPVSTCDYAENIYWIYGLLIVQGSIFDAEGIMKLLGQRGIGKRPFFWPMHQQPVFLEMGLFKEERYPNAERMANYGFYIPSGLALKDKQIETVAEVLHGVL